MSSAFAEFDQLDNTAPTPRTQRHIHANFIHFVKLPPEVTGLSRFAVKRQMSLSVRRNQLRRSPTEEPNAVWPINDLPRMQLCLPMISHAQIYYITRDVFDYGYGFSAICLKCWGEIRKRSNWWRDEHLEALLFAANLFARILIILLSN